MPFVSPHDNRTTRFFATIKRDVIIDFSGDEPQIVHEDKDQFKLTMPLVPVGEEGEAVEGVVISKFNELIEAGKCKESGWVVPLDDLNEGGVSKSYIATKVPAELLAMSQEELIALIVKMQEGRAKLTPETKEVDVEPVTEEETEGPAEVEETEKKTTARKRRTRKSTPQEEAPEEDVEESEGPEEEEDPLAKAETIKAAQNDEEVDVAF